MERPSTSKSRGICKFFTSSTGCFHGNSCKFLHGADVALTPYDKSKTCRYYAAGFCRREHACWFIHQKGSASLNQAAAGEVPEGTSEDDVQQEECGICYEKPITYGLLGGCSHAFCLRCLKEWRDCMGKSEDVVMSGNTKKCPLCRTPSLFIIPSSQFFPDRHPRKSQTIEKYKASMARIPCRYFQKSNPRKRFCPYGHDCFYQHKNDDGTNHIFNYGADHYLSNSLRQNMRRVNFLSEFMNEFGNEHLREILRDMSSNQFRSAVGTIRTNLTAVVRSNIREMDQSIRPEDIDTAADETVTNFVNYLEMIHSEVRNADSTSTEDNPSSIIPATAESNDTPSDASVVRDSGVVSEATQATVSTNEDLTSNSLQTETAITSPSAVDNNSLMTMSSPRFSTSVQRRNGIGHLSASDLRLVLSSSQQQLSRPLSPRPLTSPSLLRATSPSFIPISMRRSTSEQDLTVLNLNDLPSSDLVIPQSDRGIYTAMENVLQESNETLRNLNNIERSIADTLGMEREGVDLTDEETRNTKDSRPARIENGPRRSTGSSRSLSSVPSFVTDGRGRVIRTMEYEREQDQLCSPPCELLSLPSSPLPGESPASLNVRQVSGTDAGFITDGRGRVVWPVEERAQEESVESVAPSIESTERSNDSISEYTASA